MLRVERDPATGTTLGGGELLLSGEVRLSSGESYSTPWVHVAAADDGLDGLAAVVARPPAQPARAPGAPAGRAQRLGGGLLRPRPRRGCTAIADRAARIGVERFVLDDGWFAGRRDDTARPRRLVGRRRRLARGPRSPGRARARARHAVRAVDRAGDGQPRLRPLPRAPRLDPLRRRPGAAAASPPARARPFPARGPASTSSSDQRGALGVPHRRGEVGPQPRPARGRQRACSAGRPWSTGRPSASTPCSTRCARPTRRIDWESCASGGGRVDLGVLERVQRIWTSDMTDAVARQQIQRWTTQLVAPEYVGAHVSSPTSHTTGRTLGLDFRAATALFGSFGIEWDLTDGERGRPRPAGGVGAALQAVPAAAALRPRGPSRVERPHRAAARRRRGRPLGGPDRARPARRALTQPRDLGAGAGARPAGVLRRGAGRGPSAHGGEHVLAAPGDRTDRRRPGHRRALSTRGFWVPRRRPETVTLVHLDGIPVNRVPIAGLPGDGWGMAWSMRTSQAEGAPDVLLMDRPVAQGDPTTETCGQATRLLARRHRDRSRPGARAGRTVAMRLR